MRHLRSRLDQAIANDTVWVENVPYIKENGTYTQRSIRILFFNPNRISETDATDLCAAAQALSRRKVYPEAQSPGQRAWIVKGPYDQPATETLLAKALESGVVIIKNDHPFGVGKGKSFRYDPARITDIDARALSHAESVRSKESAPASVFTYDDALARVARAAEAITSARSQRQI